MTATRSERISLAIPIVLAAVVFARAVSFPFVGWDDPSHFVDNPLAEHPLARGLHGLFLTREIGYPAPVLLLSFALDRVLWGLSPGPYHAENVLLHVANVAMLYVLARRMRLPFLAACAVATVFAVHPLVVEPVCWVTGRKDVLSTAMVFGATLVAAGSPARSGFSPAWRWGLVNVLLALAVLVLPRTVVAPLILVAFLHALRPTWPLRRVAARLVPAFLFGVFVAIVGARQIAELGAIPPRSLATVALDVGGAWALQLSHLVFPVDRLAYYFRSPGDPPVLAMVASAFVALAVLVLALRRAPPGSAARAAIVAALLAYAPVSCVFGIRRWTADSYMYFPLAALSLALVPLVMQAWPPRLASFGIGASVLVTSVLALLSSSGTSRWESTLNVWSGSIARYPNEPLAYEHEALGFESANRWPEANAIFVQIAERFPDWEDTLDDEVRAYAAIGDASHAREVLARGVRAGNVGCIRMYWMDLIRSPDLPPADERDLIATAFRNGESAMKEGLHDPAQLRRVVAILRAVGLDDFAARVTAQLAEIERAR